jgi:S-adenosylmethionine:tRNA ribosyltransferase-isomerase
MQNLMTFIKSIEIKNYTYNLPDEKIAKYPLKLRDESKLLIYRNGEISQHQFKNIIEFLPENGLLIFNNTKVIQARIHFQKITGACIEIFCLEPHFPTEFEMIFATKNKCRWKCLVGNLKKWKSGNLIKEIIINDLKVTISASRIEEVDNNQIIEFEWNNNVSFAEILDVIGEIPIPPYLNRESEESDLVTYQTIYSKIKGSVAAPTAGLHFTENILNTLYAKNISKAEITLHVGAGTFKPVKTSEIGEHEMHTEHFFIDAEVLEQILQNQGNITAVGTTTVRTLESIYWLGVKLLFNRNSEFENNITQWEVYELQQDIKTEHSIKAILDYMKNNNLKIISASTQIIIAQGYKFRMIERLITNFHQPQSTLLLLVSAFIGDDWKKVYEFALKNDFRFLSYGDSSLLFKNQ